MYKRSRRRTFRKRTKTPRKSTFRRRTFRKKTKTPRASKSVSRSLGVADRTFVRLRYEQIVSYSGNPSFSQVWRGNSMFDPDQTGVGQQPVGYDQWSNFYRFYRVFASRIVVTFIPDEASTQPYTAVIYPSLDASVESTRLGSEYPYARRVDVMSQNVSTKRYTNYLGTEKVYGLRKGYVSFDDTYASAVGSNPSNQWYWCIVGEATDALTNIAGNIRVSITYYAEFFGRTDLSQS